MAGHNSSKKLPSLPVILLANDLSDGAVVFCTRTGWSQDPAEAWVAFDHQTAQTLEQAAQQADAACLVVDWALVEVTLSAEATPIPNHFRERFKIRGPSVRPDLGKQAVFRRN